MGHVTYPDCAQTHSPDNSASKATVYSPNVHSPATRSRVFWRGAAAKCWRWSCASCASWSLCASGWWAPPSWGSPLPWGSSVVVLLHLWLVGLRLRGIPQRGAFCKNRLHILGRRQGHTLGERDLDPKSPAVLTPRDVDGEGERLRVRVRAEGAVGRPALLPRRDVGGNDEVLHFGDGRARVGLRDTASGYGRMNVTRDDIKSLPPSTGGRSEREAESSGRENHWYRSQISPC
jgi:hypothetical protein